VLVSFDEWERLTKAPSFADLLLAFPGNPGDVAASPRAASRSDLVFARH
jgi:antitoxin Phd